MTALVVAALEEEVGRIDGVEVLVTGVGKAVAAARLSRRLATGPRPDVVVNVGTAGAVDTTLAGLHEVGYVTQHDFPYAAIEALVGRVDRGYVLRPDRPPQPAERAPAAALAVATGDTFVADPAHAATIAASGAQLVDMEAFAYAAACAAFGIPMRCVKAVSDAADAGAGESWLDLVDSCAAALGDWVRCHIASG